MRVLVCGGRDFRDATLLHETLDRYPISRLIHGAAPGADSLADDWAKGWRGVPVSPYPADWKKYGKAAGPIRNQQMLSEGRPEIVIAFPGGSGTADMIARATRAGVRVVEIKCPKKT